VTTIEESGPETRSVSNELARVTLSRTDSADVQQRQIYVRLDDGPSHTLMFGDTLTLAIPAGQHRLRANNTLFWKQVAFSVAAGEHVEFALINNAGPLGLGFLTLFGVAPLMLSIERRRSP
jgi:hypothetical protein